MAKRREKFGQQLFAPQGGFVLTPGSALPPLVWNEPETVAALVDDAAIRTRWFNEKLQEVPATEQPGRYFAYGETMGPGGSSFRRAMTCVCAPPDTDLHTLAAKWTARTNDDARRAQEAEQG